MKSKFDEALILLKKGQLDKAKNIFSEILNTEPNNFAAYNNMGNISFLLGNLDEALQNYDKAIKLKPDFADAHNNRGNVFHKIKKIDAALESYERAIEINANHVQAISNRGNIFLNELKKIEDAVQSYNTALKLNPNNSQNYNNLGVALKKLNKRNAALESYEKAIKIKPDYAEAYHNKGNILYELQKTDEALQSYEKAIKIKPDYAEAHYNKGNILLGANINSAALDSFKKALEIKPDLETLSGIIMYTKLKMSDWENLDKDLENLKDEAADSKNIPNPFFLMSVYDLPKILRSAAKKWSDRETSFLPLNQQSYQSRNPLNSNEALDLIPKKEMNKKIKIGYYSADFREHAVGQLVVNLFELHDKSKFEIFAFYFGPDVNDDIHKRITNASHKFINVRSKNDTEIAQLSRDLQIDIAVDLMGFTVKNRFRIFVERCAPLQVGYLGYPGTTGSNCIDYLIADKILIPKENQQHFSEKIIYLPNSYLAGALEKKKSEKIFTREELGLPKNGFVFCCFNQSYKILPKIFDTWMRILKRVNNSVLWLYETNEIAYKNLKQEAANRDVDSNRIVFAKRLPLLEEHLERYKSADLFLDTFPYTAHSTCSDSLRAGLPVLTLQGETFASRVSSSLLEVAGLKELITHSTKEYEDKAVEFANDLSKLKNIKKKLDTNKDKTAIFDTKLLTNHIEQAYLEIYRKYNESKKPENIEIK